MVCCSFKRSHRALLRIIHAIVFDAHHAVRNGVDKERKRRLTLALLLVPKERRRGSSRTERADKSAKTFSPINPATFEKGPVAILTPLAQRASFCCAQEPCSPAIYNHGNKAAAQSGPGCQKSKPTMLALRSEPLPLQLHQCSQHETRSGKHTKITP